MDQPTTSDLAPNGIPGSITRSGSRSVPACLVGFLILAPTVVVAVALATCMTEYRPASLWAAAGSGLVGAGLTMAVAFRVYRFSSTRQRVVTVSIVAAALIAIPGASIVWPGRITASGFGWTVYGAIPVPTFDLRIGASGIPWFRDKTHHVSLEEARGVVSPGVEVLVIGAGWDGVVQVDPAVRRMEGVEVFIAPTPEAFAEYNRLKSEGRRVALLAHSSC